MNKRLLFCWALAAFSAAGSVTSCGSDNKSNVDSAVEVEQSAENETVEIPVEIKNKLQAALDKPLAMPGIKKSFRYEKKKETSDVIIKKVCQPNL